MKDSLIKTSIDASLFVQLTTLFLNLFAFTVPLDVSDFALKEILGLETVVQVIELVFYSWYRVYLLNNSFDVTKYRYYDWFFTTPVMLFSTASYYGYLERKQDAKKEPFSVLSFFKQNAKWIFLMFLLNAFMLLFGYLQEIGLLSIVWSSIFGYLSLIGSFTVLYKFASRVPTEEQTLFKYMFGIWSLYGVAAALPPKEKNISYNGLDILAKNFYGVFLSYLIYKKQV